MHDRATRILAKPNRPKLSHQQSASPLASTGSVDAARDFSCDPIDAELQTDLQIDISAARPWKSSQIALAFHADNASFAWFKL